VALAPPFRESATEWTETPTRLIHQSVAGRGLRFLGKIGNCSHPDLVPASLNAVVEHDDPGMPQDSEECQESH
jgi:hypothetical protein